MERLFYIDNDYIYLDYKAFIDTAKEMGVDDSELFAPICSLKNSNKIGAKLIPIGNS